MIEQFTNAEGKKAFLIAIAFLAFFLIVPQEWHGAGPDYEFHWLMAQGECPTGYTAWACEHYPPLFHWIASFFTVREVFFKFFVLLLFAVVTPLLLFLITKRAIAVWFYFSTTSYFYYIDAGLYSQGLALILMLSIFATKNNAIRLGILILSIIAHSTSFYLVSFTFLAVLLKENFLEKDILFCSPFWGGEVPAILKTQILPGIGSTNVPDMMTLNKLLAFFVKVCPLPFLYWGIRGHIAKRRYDFLAVAALAFVMAFLYMPRILYTIPLLIIPGLVWYYEDCRIKKAIILLSVIYFLFLIEQWLAISTMIFC